MILKKSDSKNRQIEELGRLLCLAPLHVKKKIEQELRILKAGERGEKEAAYFIDFDLKDSKNTVVIHDLRLEINGRVAQIDHLLIHRTMTFFVLESKHFHAGLKIGEDGQFLQWNSYKKTFEGMASPLAQNERHITVLKDLISQIEWPTRLGIKLTPKYESIILISSKARIDRPKKLDTSQIVKADELMKKIDKTFDSRGVLDVFGAMAKLVSPETLQDVGAAIAAMHRPKIPDYAAKFGLTGQTTAEPVPESPMVKEEQTAFAPSHVCRKCGSSELSIQYGRYGYYFKCSSCDGNTPVKLGCGQDGHKERLRKKGLEFFRECADCGSSKLFFVNT